MKYIAHARVGSKLRVSLPAKVRELLGKVEPGDYLIFFRDHDNVCIEKGEVRPLIPSVISEESCIGFSKLSSNLRIRILPNIAELLGGLKPDDFLLFAEDSGKIYITKGGLTGAGHSAGSDEG